MVSNQRETQTDQSPTLRTIFQRHAAAVLFHALFISPITWGVMRFVTGVCMAGLYVVAESWLNDIATNATRGRVPSVYIIVMNAAFATGPLLLNLGDASGSDLLVVAGILFVAALLPVALTRTGNPEIGEQARLGIGSLFLAYPV